MDRIQRTRNKGSKLPPNTLCVTRGTYFGNPFKKSYARESGDRVVNLFREFMKRDSQKKTIREFIGMCEVLDIKHLACWCKPDEVCHADVWLEIWNKYQSESEDTARMQAHQAGDGLA